MNTTEIMLRRKNMYISLPEEVEAVTEEKGLLTKETINKVENDLNQLGYRLSEQIIGKLQAISEFVDISLYTEELIYFIKGFAGDKGYQILNEDYTDEVTEQEIAKSSKNLIEIKEGTIKEVILEAKNLMAAVVSLTEQDKEDLKELISFLEANGELKKAIPEEIPYKENVAFIIKTLIKYGHVDNEDIQQIFNSATDILRLAVSLSEGDVSLSTRPYFRKFAHSEKVLLLTLLDCMTNAEQDMTKYREYWLRLGEIIHPASKRFKNRFPNAYKAFTRIREQRRVPTIMTKVEEAYKAGDIKAAVDHVKNRPGEFARRLDALLRNSDEELNKYILNEFQKVVRKVSRPVRYQLFNHICNRQKKELTKRVVTPKGSGGLVHLLDKPQKGLSQDTEFELKRILSTSLVEDYQEKEDLGKVYIDPLLKNYAMPLQERNASKQLNPISKGTRLPLGDNDVLRFFTWWKNMDSNTHSASIDVDLSATFLNDDLTEVEGVSYTEQKKQHLGAYHSGDIVDAPNGATEYIDISKQKVIEQGYRYIVMTLHSYSMQPFAMIPEASAGFMTTKGYADKEFNPLNVERRFDLDTQFKTTTPIIFDLEKNEAVWVDTFLKNLVNVNQYMLNNRESYEQELKGLIKALTESKHVSLYELYYLHATARGQVISEYELNKILKDNKEKTEEDQEKVTVFKAPTKQSPLDVADIVANYV